MSKFWRKRKRARNKDEWYPLVKDMHIHYTETSNAGEEESTVDSVMPSGSSVEVSGETGLHILRKILSEQLDNEDADTAAAMPKISFSQEWHHKYLQEINQFVENHFPTLPAEEPRGSQLEQIQDFLKSTQSVICNEMRRLIPLLKDAGLLVHLMDSYSRHLFTKLDLLLIRDLSLKEIFCLIMWEKDVFFSPDLKLSVCDPSLLTGGFERAKQKLLQVLQNDISTYLQNILRFDEEHGHNEDSMDEETFIRVHLDVTQCLICAILDAQKVGLTLMHAVQILCSGELHDFVQKYVDAENERLKRLKFTEKNSVYLFRIINTCMQLRCCATQISPNSDIESSTICMLQKLEDNASSIVRKNVKCLAQANFESYFEKRNGDIDILMQAIQRQCASLPETASEIKTVVVRIAYDSVSKVYLECLMKTNFRSLEKCWGDAEEKIKEDVHHFHKTFSELNGSADQQSQLLQRMTEVLHCIDVDTLKITCSKLFKDFPQESEQYVPGLLRWKGVLSERQVREVLEVSREPCQNPDPTHHTHHPLKGLFCFF